jgi:uncharacterized membrane protein
MESRTKVAGHPVHPMLVAFPIGLLLTALIFDVIYLVSDEPRWAEVSWYMIAAGVIGGLAAAIPGLIDWFAIPPATRAKRIGLLHAVGNVVVLGLFFLSWLIRGDAPGAPPTEAIVAELLGAGLMAVTGWLGGELVDRLGVGVDDGAHLDAPSSLSGDAERRHSPQPAYAGVERRGYGART